MRATLLFLVFLISAASAVTLTFQGGVGWPGVSEPAHEIAWFNTCGFSGTQYPIEMSFDYDTSLVDRNQLYQALPMTAVSIRLQSGDTTRGFNQLVDNIWQPLGTPVIQLIQGEFAGMQFSGTNTDGADLIRVDINNFSWTLREVRPFVGPFAGGYFFPCDLKTTNPTDDSCRLDPCGAHCVFLNPSEECNPDL